MKLQSHFILLCLMALVIVSGCKNRNRESEKVRVHGLTQEEVMAKHLEAQAKFKILGFKGKADFESTKEGKTQSMGFSYRIYIAKDSLLWGSISKMGISFGTVLVDQDSVKMRISLGKIAVVCGFDLLSEMVGMDVNFLLLQSFFTGDPILGDGELKMSAEAGKGIRLDESRPPYAVSWFLNGKTFKLDKMVAEDSNLGRSSSVVYSEFEEVSGQLIPGRAVIEATQPNQSRIELEHTKIEVDPTKSTFAFRIPKSYEIKSCSFK